MSSTDFACILDLDVSYPISVNNRFDEKWLWSQDDVRQFYEYIYYRRQEDRQYLQELFGLAPTNQSFDEFLTAHKLYRECYGKWCYKLTDIGNENPVSFNLGSQYMRVNDLLSALSVRFKNKLFILRGMYRQTLSLWNSNRIWYNVYFNGDYTEYMGSVTIPQIKIHHVLKDKNHLEVNEDGSTEN